MKRKESSQKGIRSHTLKEALAALYLVEVALFTMYYAKELIFYPGDVNKWIPILGSFPLLLIYFLIIRPPGREE